MADQRAPGLLAELPRMQALGAALLGIVGDVNHRYGYHIPSSRVAPDDYSMRGAQNRPDGDFACALDAGMGWPAARKWLAWLIAEIAADRITGVAEVIGSLDGRTARYWSDADGWTPQGVPYRGSGHVTWTHVGIYRSTARVDHRLFAGWTAVGLLTQEDDMPDWTDRVKVPADLVKHFPSELKVTADTTMSLADLLWRAPLYAAQATSAARAVQAALGAHTELEPVAGGVDLDALADRVVDKLAARLADAAPE